MNTVMNIMRSPVMDTATIGGKPVEPKKTKRTRKQVEGQFSLYDTGVPNIIVYEAFCCDAHKACFCRHVPEGQLVIYNIGVEWATVVQFPAAKLLGEVETKAEAEINPVKKPSVEELIENNTGLVRYCMGGIGGVTSLNAQDIEQVGLIALWKSAQRFDPSRGVKFVSYAIPAIKRAMYREVSGGQDKLNPESLDVLGDYSSQCVSLSAPGDDAFHNDDNAVVDMMLDVADSLRMVKEQKGVKAYAMHLQGYSGTQIAEAVGVKESSYTALISAGRKVVQSHPLFMRAAAELNNTPRENPVVNLLGADFELRYAKDMTYDVPARFEDDYETMLIKLLSQEQVAEYLLFEPRIGEPVCIINKDTGCTSVLNVQKDYLELTYAIQTSRAMKKTA